MCEYTLHFLYFPRETFSVRLFFWRNFNRIQPPFLSENPPVRNPPLNVDLILRMTNIIQFYLDFNSFVIFLQEQVFFYCFFIHARINPCSFTIFYRLL